MYIVLGYTLIEFFIHAHPIISIVRYEFTFGKNIKHFYTHQMIYIVILETEMLYKIYLFIFVLDLYEKTATKCISNM